eukprot:1188739-Rhodomonas_salina.1
MAQRQLRISTHSQSPNSDGSTSFSCTPCDPRAIFRKSSYPSAAFLLEFHPISKDLFVYFTKSEYLAVTLRTSSEDPCKGSLRVWPSDSGRICAFTRFLRPSRPTNARILSGYTRRSMRLRSRDGDVNNDVGGGRDKNDVGGGRDKND